MITPEGYDTSQIYCLFCVTGKEREVEEALKAKGLRVIPTLIEDRLVKNRVRKKVRRSVIPGYVFFAADVEPEWKVIRRIKHVYRPLFYADLPGQRALRGADLDFVEALIHWGKTGRGISRAFREGSRIRIIDGPLTGRESCIVAVNYKRRRVRVQLGAALINIWLPYEEVEELRP